MLPPDLAAAILDKIGTGSLSPDFAQRALGLLLEATRREGELAGFTAGQAASALEAQREKEFVAAVTAVLTGKEATHD